MRCCNCNRMFSDVTNTSTSVICDYCGIRYMVTIENIETMTMGTSNNRLKEEILNIEIGSVVILRNEDHIFHGQKVKIIDKKHKFVKIDLVGRTSPRWLRDQLWVPNEWVEYYETN